MSVAQASPAAAQAPPVVAAPPGNPRFPLIDSMRAIAALCVVVTHVAAASGESFNSPMGVIWAQLTIGVPIFFLISGFLLYRPFFAARFHGRSSPRVLTYARRRFLRIVPAYWAALLALSIVLTLNGVLTHDWWIYFGFLQSYQRITVLGGIPQAWSLCVEVSFYALLPVYALVMARAARRLPPARMVRLELSVLIGLYLLAVAFRTWAAGTGHEIFFQTLPGTFDWFALGMALAVASVALEGREAPRPVRALLDRPGWCWAAAIASFVAMCLILDLPVSLAVPYTASEVLVQHTTFGLVALLLLVPAVFARDGGGIPRRILSLRSLAWLGMISYGIFLYNLTFSEWLIGRGVADWLPGGRFWQLLLFTLVASVVAAAASYYLLERPILRFKGTRR